MGRIEIDRVAKQGCNSPTCLMTMVALLCHSPAQAALPPPTAQTSAPETVPVPASAGATQSGAQSSIDWSLPPIRLGGSVNYSLRRNTAADGQQNRQSGLSTTLNASTDTYIWHPWFAQVDGNLGFTVATASSRSGVGNAGGKNVAVTGRGQVSVLPRSKFPFEAHFERSDSRASSDLAVSNEYASQRYGFSQRYFRPQGEVMFGWDRSTQTSSITGRDLQDRLQLRMTQRLENHDLQFNGDRSADKRVLTGEHAVQKVLTLQHRYTPKLPITVNSLVNLSRSDYRLQQGSSNSRLLQLSTSAFWQPEGQPINVSGGVRMFTVETDSGNSTVSGSAVDNRYFNFNANLGVSYEFNKYIRFNAGVNANSIEVNGVKTVDVSTNQSLGMSYQGDPIDRGGFRYNWGSSANLSNQTSNDGSDRQLTLQFSHSLSRNFTLPGASTVVVNASQSASTTASSSVVTNGEPPSTKQISHQGSVSWNLPKFGSALVQLTASDTRALDGNQDYFQLINLQVSSNLMSSGSSSLVGSLTIQSTRQGIGPTRAGTSQSAEKARNNGFATSSSGSISYQNQRFLGYRRLNFGSDLRLNSDALVPLFGSDEDQELAAWDNRIDYSIGRTQLRLNLLVSRSSSPKNGAETLDGVENTGKESKINKSIMFTVSRTFGVF